MTNDLHGAVVTLLVMLLVVFAITVVAAGLLIGNYGTVRGVSPASVPIRRSTTTLRSRWIA